MSNDRTRLSGRNYDRTMYLFFNAMQQQSLSRRGLLKAGAGIAGACAMMAAMPSILPGIGVLAQDGETLTFGLESDPRGVEPALGYDFTANVVICNITEGPVMVDASGALQTLLAESFEQPDQLTYIYNLRPGVKFHDGSELTAADMIASIERVRNPVDRLSDGLDVRSHRVDRSYRRYAGNHQARRALWHLPVRVVDHRQSRHAEEPDRLDARYPDTEPDRHWPLQVRVLGSGKRNHPAEARRVLAGG